MQIMQTRKVYARKSGVRKELVSFRVEPDIYKNFHRIVDEVNTPINPANESTVGEYLLKLGIAQYRRMQQRQHKGQMAQVA